MVKRNPYLNRSMLRSVDAFYGRRAELARTMARLGDATPQSVSIVGERRVGKSSLLWHLSQPEVAARYLDEPERTLFVYVDFQGQRHLDLPGFSRVLGRQLAAAAAPRLDVAAAGDLTGLEGMVQALTAAGLRVVGLFDEFETVTGSPAFGAEFFGFLRSLANSYPVAFVTATRRELQSLCHTQAISESPFFNIFARVPLAALDEADSARLIAEPSAAAGVPLAEHAAQIVDLAGHLPLYLQMACSAAFECLTETGSFDGQLTQRRFREEADAHLDYLWAHLEEGEQEVVARLLRGAALEGVPGGAVDSLVARGVLRRAGGSLRVFSAALAPLLAEKGRVDAAASQAAIAADPAPPAPAVEAPDAQVLRLEPLPEGARPYPRLIGGSVEVRRLFTFVERAAASQVTVLLLGETGTGKELVAHTIHEHSERRDGPFVVVNCGAIAENLQESELFGHRRGAFTDAVADKEGLIEAAHGGTLMLDEIAEMTPATQVKLLRVLQEREVRRVGDTEARKVEVRVIGATNRDLEAEVADGRFREDLYYRLCVLVARLPPLRQRRDDIPGLVTHFLGTRPVAAEALGLLAAHEWPGNVRELENQLAAACAVAGDAPIRPEHLWPRLQRLTPVPVAPQPEAATTEPARSSSAASPSSLSSPSPAERWASLTLREAREAFERELLSERLSAHDGELTQVARSLGISRSRLYELVRKYELRSE